MFSTHPNAPPVGSVSAPRVGNEPFPAASASASAIHTTTEEESSYQAPDVNVASADPVGILSSGSSATNASRPVISNSR